MIDVVNIKGKKVIFVDEISFGYPLDINLSGDGARLPDAIDYPGMNTEVKWVDNTVKHS